MRIDSRAFTCRHRSSLASLKFSLVCWGDRHLSWHVVLDTIFIISSLPGSCSYQFAIVCRFIVVNSFVCLVSFVQSSMFRSSWLFFFFSLRLGPCFHLFATPTRLVAFFFFFSPARLGVTSRALKMWASTAICKYTLKSLRSHNSLFI